MWVLEKKYLQEGREYSVMDKFRFVHPAIYLDGVFLNRVTKVKIINITKVFD
jgi:hypothetical protein